MKVEHVFPSDYQALLIVWENSVRATHDFISDDDIEFFKPFIIEQAFPNVELRCVKDQQGNILGFIGTSDQKVEMLFVDDNQRGQGIGKVLMRYALENFAVTQVDVNEQNPKAVGFYQSFGFNITSRSPLDDMGKPFPILHLKL